MSNEFTFTYDATTGILIAAALREKAEAERGEANMNYQNGTGYEELVRTGLNRAKLFEDAAEAIHAPVRAALAADMGEALRKAGVVE